MKKTILLLVLALLLCLMLAACTEKKPGNDQNAELPTVAGAKEPVAPDAVTQTGPVGDPEDPEDPAQDYPDPDEGEGGLEIEDEVVVEVTGDVSFGGN